MSISVRFQLSIHFVTLSMKNKDAQFLTKKISLNANKTDKIVPFALLCTRHHPDQNQKEKRGKQHNTQTQQYLSK